MRWIEEIVAWTADKPGRQDVILGIIVVVLVVIAYVGEHLMGG